MHKLTELLNKEVANFGLLYIKLHNYHWFIKGKLFFELHAKFEELYDEIAEHYDEVAERMLMLDMKPAATLKEYLQLASLKEATGNESTEDMINTIISDFEQLDQELKEGVKMSEDAGDDVTADLLLGIKASLEKHLWMLKTTLK